MREENMEDQDVFKKNSGILIKLGIRIGSKFLSMQRGLYRKNFYIKQNLMLKSDFRR